MYSRKSDGLQDMLDFEKLQISDERFEQEDECRAIVSASHSETSIHTTSSTV